MTGATRVRLRRFAKWILVRLRIGGRDRWEGDWSTQPDWGPLLRRDGRAWRRARSAADEGPSVLVAVSTGGFYHLAAMESVLSVALALRGARVEVLLCDEAFPACLACRHSVFPDTAAFISADRPAMLCADCWRPARNTFRKLGIRVRTFGELATDDERALARRLAAEVPRDGIAAYRLDGVAVGEHASAGALRYFARGVIDDEPFAEAVLRRYFEASLLTAFAARRLFGEREWRCAVFNHGIYVPQGVVGECARAAGVRVVNWNPAYRKQCFIFSHGDTYHHTLMNEPAEAWTGMELDGPREARLMDYLKSRWSGTNDWIWFHERPQEQLDKISAELGIDFTRPCVGLLTNVVWDAQLHYPANAFPNMLEWIKGTVAYFAGRPELQLVIRVHPAEIRGTIPSRQRVVDELAAAFPHLPPNVFVVGPESAISTYAVMECCDTVLIYGTKTGVELTSMGIPVIVAGEAWIRNKGLTRDALSVAHYYGLLDTLPTGNRMSAEQTALSRKYAFHFFFRRMIPILVFDKPAGSRLLYRLMARRLDDLAPGADRGLDVVTAGILEGSPFIYPAEKD